MPPRDNSMAERFSGEGETIAEVWVAPYSAKLRLLVTAAGDRRLKEADLRVLVALVHRANSETGRCFPSVQKIADDTRLKLRGAQVAVARLEAAGYLCRKIGAGPRGANFYVIAWAHGGAPLHDDASVHEDALPQGGAPLHRRTPAPLRHAPLHRNARAPVSARPEPPHGDAPKQKTLTGKETGEGKRVAVPGDARAQAVAEWLKEQPFSEDDLKDAVNLACEVEGTGARLCRAAGIINPAQLRNWRWSRKAVRFTTAQLAALAADPAVQSAHRRLTAEAERQFHTSNLESSHA